VDNISRLKKQIRDKGDDVGEAEFNKIFEKSGSGNTESRKPGGHKKKMIDMMRDNHR